MDMVNQNNSPREAYKIGEAYDFRVRLQFGKNLYGFYKFWDGYETPRKAYASMIDKTQKKGFWESNPWCIIYKFELTKEE